MAEREVERDGSQGKGAFLVAAVIALVGGAFQVWHNGVPLNNWGALATSFAQVWTVSQIFFVAVVQMFGLDVQSN